MGTILGPKYIPYTYMEPWVLDEYLTVTEGHPFLPKPAAVVSEKLKGQ